MLPLFVLLHDEKYGSSNTCSPRALSLQSGFWYRFTIIVCASHSDGSLGLQINVHPDWWSGFMRIIMIKVLRIQIYAYPNSWSSVLLTADIYFSFRNVMLTRIHYHLVVFSAHVLGNPHCRYIWVSTRISTFTFRGEYYVLMATWCLPHIYRERTHFFDSWCHMLPLMNELQNTWSLHPTSAWHPMDNKCPASVHSIRNVLRVSVVVLL